MKSLTLMAFLFGAANAKRLSGVTQEGGNTVRILTIGLVIAIVYLATYFVSTMERVW